MPPVGRLVRIQQIVSRVLTTRSIILEIRAERQVDNIGDCVDNDRSTFFQEPGEDRIRITLLIRTIK